MKTLNEDLVEFELISLGFLEGWTYGRMQETVLFRELDFDKLLEVINENKENILSVEVGLGEDWCCTSGEVYNSFDGFIKEYYYTSSRWATPVASIEFKNGTTFSFECWKEGENENGYFENIQPASK